MSALTDRRPRALPEALALAALLVVVAGASAGRAEPVYLGAASRGALSPAVTKAFRASLERSLAKQGIRVLDTSSAAEETAEEALTRARAALEDATKAYGDEDWAGAMEATKAALSAFERGAAYTEDDKAWDLFRDILSLKALIHLKQKKPALADDALRSLLAVLPKYAPNRDRAPPELVRHLDDMRDELRSLPPVTLEVRSKPAGGIVIVDGRKRGRAPLVVEDLTPGTHYVAVESPTRGSEGPPQRYIERVEVGEDGAAVSAKLQSKKGAFARDVVSTLAKPTNARALVEAVGEVDEDGLIAVLLPAGKKIEVIGARVTGGEVRVVCGVRVPDTDNDRERATFVLVEGLLEGRSDAWLDDARGEDPTTLRPKLFTGTGVAVTEEELAAEEEPVSPAVIAVGVIAGIVSLAALGTGVGVYVSRELKKDEGFTWSVDAGGL